ncbi:hypothetical protein Taro_032459 [Colocasia esculenta]|uniref:CCHC-type domain-containing protein n=1 Tax=Colocasia esculenta TaxID=4460 RepID=A0A843VLD5_COLES|nr:hypothetical protein [Colocasia esculenta]
MQSCIIGNPNSCLSMVGGLLKPHTLYGRKKSSLKRKLTCQNRNMAFLVIVGLLKHHGCLNTLHQTLGTSFRTCWGPVEMFLVAGEQEIIHTKPFFFPVVSIATCTDHHLGVELRAQLVEDTMAKVEGMRGKDNAKPVFVKKGAPNTAPMFRSNNNNFNSNKKRPNAGRDAAGDKRVKMEGRQLSENCKFCDKPGHRAGECWKKLGACLRCGGRDHRIPDYPMMKDQPGRAQNVPRRQGRLNAVIEADLPNKGDMVEGLLIDADMGSTQRLVLACQQAAQLLESALEVTKDIKKETNQNGKRRYNHGKKANQQVNRNSEIICLHCHKPGHAAKECWRKIGAWLRCGNSRHQLRDCPLLEESATNDENLNSMTKGKRPNNSKLKNKKKVLKRERATHSNGVVGVSTFEEEIVRSDSEREQ